MSKVQVGADRNRANRFGVKVAFVFLKALVPGILLCLSVSSTAAQANAKNVLVLFSSVKYSEAFLDAVEPFIRARVPGPITFYDAYLDDPQVEQRSYRESMAETLRRRYAGVKMDVVIAVNPAAIFFTAEYRDKIFPGVPIVFVAINKRELEGQKLPPVMTGVVTPLGFRETIDLALRLQPDTNAFAVVTGVTSWDSRQLGFLHSELVRYQDKVKEIDLVGPPNGQMLERVAALPPHAVVLFQTFPQFSDQPNFGTWDLLAAVAQLRPTYSVFQRLCVSGCIGGEYGNDAKEWLSTADLAARVLSGERPQNIPIVYDSDLQAQVDWRALNRWHIPESALPQGTAVLNRPPSLWESYRRYFIAVIVVICALLLLVAGLLWERARKRKAEALLRESEKRFRAMADTTPSLVWMCDPQGRISYLNERRIAFTGPDPDAGYGDTWIEYVHPDDRRNVEDVVSQGLKDRKPFSNEYRLRRSDGVYRWMFDVASPRLNGDGSFAGLIGSAIDVTDQKLAQQALEMVSGQLIEAQENERRRIARDLHDDICQRLALLSIELHQANRGANVSDDVTKQRLREIQQHCAEIAGDVQSLSHQLHSSQLDYLGIVAAIRGFCHEFSKQHEVSVEFTERDVPADLPREISVCLFRVAQEALHNAVKYSGVSQYAVELTATGDEIQLVVSDSGTGFDVEAARKNRGLGLVSMQERVHLVHGSLYVESEPGEGTRILAIIPVTGENRRSASLPEAIGSTEPRERDDHFAC
jgi:PAS domain S-box-containing protein